MNKQTVLYARVSTDEQADKGYSLPSQLEACRKYAERLGYTVVTELREDHSGATPIAERPEGKKLAELLKRHEADAIIAYQVDRLSRDIVDLLASVRNWLRAGIEVHACDIGKVESELDIVLVIKGWQGGDERKRIVERCTRGRYTKARAGKVVGAGPAAYGYQYTDGCLIIIEEEARIVRLIFIWYTEGDGNGKPMSAFAIARRLSEMRIPSPGERKGYARLREPGMWATSAVYSILTNETYAGVWRYRKRQRVDGRLIKRQADEQIAVSVPAVIDRDLWERVQARRAYNRRMAKRNAKREYLLRGMVKCGCGAAMSASYCGANYYYKCVCRLHRFAGLEERCKEKPVLGKRLEAFAWDYVLTLMKDPKDFERKLFLAQKEEDSAIEPKRERLDAVKAMLVDCEKEAAEVARAFAKKGDGAVGRALEAQIIDVEARDAALRKERDALQTELNAKRLTDDNIKAALQFRADVMTGMQTPTFEDKRRILELLQTEVIVRGGQARVRCLVPSQPTTIDFDTFCSILLPRSFQLPHLSRRFDQ